MPKSALCFYCEFTKYLCKHNRLRYAFFETFPEQILNFVPNSSNCYNIFKGFQTVNSLPSFTQGALEQLGPIRQRKKPMESFDGCKLQLVFTRYWERLGSKHRVRHDVFGVTFRKPTQSRRISSFHSRC